MVQLNLCLNTHILISAISVFKKPSGTEWVTSPNASSAIYREQTTAKNVQITLKKKVVIYSTWKTVCPTSKANLSWQLWKVTSPSSNAMHVASRPWHQLKHHRSCMCTKSCRTRRGSKTSVGYVKQTRTGTHLFKEDKRSKISMLCWKNKKTSKVSVKTTK